MIPVIGVSLVTAGLAIAPASAGSEMADALRLCLDTSHSLSARQNEFEALGWSTGSASDTDAKLLATALIIEQVEPMRPESWGETQIWAETQAAKAAPEIAKATLATLTAPGGAASVILTRNRVGLQTCLFLGREPDLSPVAKILDGSILRQIGDVARIRGDGPKSLIAAAAILPDGQVRFDPALSYNVTFTVVLDRQPGDTQ